METFLAPIDPHVHFRGTEYPDQNFMKEGFRDARAAGLVAVMEQPNPTPNLTSTDVIAKRIILGHKVRGCGNIKRYSALRI